MPDSVPMQSHLIWCQAVVLQVVNKEIFLFEVALVFMLMIERGDRHMGYLDVAVIMRK